uniref:Uncharacterized protein isoform X1 n=2 Tax=Pogona vitticeps TaxID=103695 RepID=A0ABM5GHA4_9SAUR
MCVWLMHILGLEQMGYKGVRNGMYCYRKLPGKNVPLMESETIKEGDPFTPEAHEFNEVVDFTPARKHQDGTKVITMSSISEEVEQEKDEDISFAQDLTLLFVVEEQIWGRLSNAVQKEASVERERSQRDPDTWTEPSEGERNLCIQEARDTSLHGHLEADTAVSSLSCHQSSLVTQAQVPSSPNEVAEGQVGIQVLTAGFPQPPNSYDTFSEVQGEETIVMESVAAQKESDYECLPVSHDISKCHQNAESFEDKSGVNHSLEIDTQQEMNEGILESMQAVQDTEMHPHTEGAGQTGYSFSTKNEEQRVRDLKGEREDEESSASSQSCSGTSEDKGIHADMTQTKSGGILSLISSQIVENHLEMEEKMKERVKNSSSAVLHFLVKEEDDEGENRAPSLKEIIKTNGAESPIDCSESESDQKELLQKVKPESAETETLELGDNGRSGKEKILDWKGMENKMGENDKPELECDAQEGQKCDMKAMKASREKVQRKRAATPVIPGLDMLSNMAKNVASPDLNQNNSLANTEGFAVSLEQGYPSSHCPKSTSGLPESCVHATSMPLARTPTEGLRIVPPVCPDSRPLEGSGRYDQADHTSHSGHNGDQPTEEDRKGSFENESAGGERSVRDTDGEGMRVSCGDLVLSPDPEDLYDIQPEDYPVDVEIHIPPFSLGTTKAESAQQVISNKGASDSIVGNAVFCEKSDSLKETPNENLSISCHLDLMAHDEASAVDSDMVVQDSSKTNNFTEDFHEDIQDSASENLQNISLGEGLYDTTQHTVESYVSSWTTQNPVSFQEKDTTVHYFEESHQHQKPTEIFVFPRKDTGADTLHMEQQTSNNESAALSVFGQNGTVGDHNTVSPASLDISFATATDVTQLTKPLTSVPISEQTLALEPTSTHFCQLSLPASDCRQPVQSLVHTQNANAPAHTETALGLHPRHPTQHEDPLASASKASQFLAPIESPSSSTPSPSAGHFEQHTASVCDLNQCSQSPESVRSSDQPLSLGYAAKEAVPIVSLTSSSSSSLIPDANQFAQHSVGAPAPNLPINCIEGDNWAHASGPISNLVSQRAPPVYESKSISQLHNMESRVEEVSVGTSASQGQKDWNTPEAHRDYGVDLLGAHSDSIPLGNDTFPADGLSGIPEPMAKFMDTPDGKGSFDLISHHLVDSQKKCETTESRNSRETPLLLAFTNPIHFLQLGPPSPPTTRHPQRQHADSQEPQWWQADPERDAEDMTAPMVSQQSVGNTGRFRVNLGKSVREPLPAVIPRKDRTAKHLPLEKSSSCPHTNVAGSDTKESASNSKKQEQGRINHRTKSKDWHRQGVRKTSIPSDNLLEGIAPLVTSKEEASAPKDKTEHFDRVKYGEIKTAAAVENFKRRHSKLINSSRLLYQEYSDVALNKAIQNQKRDSLSEDVEPGSSPSSPRLRRKVLPSQDSYLQRLSVSSSASLWQDIPMVRGSTMLLSMTREEQKLQEAKFELIASEASYLRSLNIAVDHFQHSQELQAVLSNQDRQWLFSRLQDVRDVSANFLFDLEEKLEENMFTFNVCDVALRHAPEFHRVYLPYVTNQTYQEQIFRRLMNDVPAFQQVLEKLESDPICQRLSLKSFLILPFQRITRLKLLLQNILKRTRPGAEEEIQATQAYDALEKLIKDCNENVQRMKNTEQLISLSKNMAFECKIFPLISQSRRLVKHGELTALEYNPGLKWKLTTRSIYLHLFNDSLLLSRPRENGRFIVFDYAASSDVRGEKCEMKLHGTNKNVFRLFLLRNHQGKKVEFLFRTETQSEKLRWISALTPQQIELDFLDDPEAAQVQGMKSYKPRENDELAVEKADIIMVLKQSSDGWIEGVRLSDGERGWFPSDHVDFISSKQVRQMNLKEEQRVKDAKQQVFHRN